MIDIVIEMFSYSFIVKAFIVGVLVSVCSSLLGVSLVLKRYSMIGDGLSHVGFGALAIATALGTAPLIITIPVVLVAAFFLLRITGNAKIKGDAAIAIISSGALALGILVLSMTTGMNTDLFNYMFGSILSLTESDAVLSIIISIFVISLYVIFYNRIFAVTFDEDFARSSGIKVDFYNMLIATLTAVTVVLGMRMMGSLLISSLIIFPAVIAMSVCKRFKGVVICSVVVSVLCFVIGMILSYIAETPSGATIVVVNCSLLIIIKFINIIKKST